MNINSIFDSLELNTQLSGCYAGAWESGSETLQSISPIDGTILKTITTASSSHYELIAKTSSETFRQWRLLPAPKRGELVRDLADEFRRLKKELGALITLEMGKILPEGEGEVQEVIDIADFAVGLSRQLYGNSMHSERPMHRMYEQWHPLGPTAVITAFNFPAAVWAWNAMIAAVCGNSVVWKPSELTPLVSIAVTKICQRVATAHGFPGLFSLLIDSNGEHGKKLAADERYPLVSATGSCRMGQSVGTTVASRFGRSLLELGGNNAIIVMDDADPELALRAILFGAVGTAGQRCTSTRRVFLHSSISKALTERLLASYRQIKIGNPLSPGTLCGPLISKQAVLNFSAAIEKIAKQGGQILCGGKVLTSMPSEFYVEPTLVAATAGMEILKEETFAPILYLLTFEDLDQAIRLQNDVPQGLSSAIFTNSLKSAEQFLSASGSDCGIANVNIGTSGAEIGGAFGGEKHTGGGREAGSDSWKAYMRRQTNTINWGDQLPLAQGIKFE